MDNGTNEWVLRLGQAQAVLETARAQALAWVMQATSDRDQIIREACRSGLSQSEVARITGLTRSRISQIVTSSEENGPR